MHGDQQNSGSQQENGLDRPDAPVSADRKKEAAMHTVNIARDVQKDKLLVAESMPVPPAAWTVLEQIGTPFDEPGYTLVLRESVLSGSDQIFTLYRKAMIEELEKKVVNVSPDDQTQIMAEINRLKSLEFDKIQTALKATGWIPSHDHVFSRDKNKIYQKGVGDILFARVPLAPIEFNDIGSLRRKKPLPAVTPPSLVPASVRGTASHAPAAHVPVGAPKKPLIPSQKSSAPLPALPSAPKLPSLVPLQLKRLENQLYEAHARISELHFELKHYTEDFFLKSAYQKARIRSIPQELIDARALETGYLERRLQLYEEELPGMDPGEAEKIINQALYDLSELRQNMKRRLEHLLERQNKLLTRFFLDAQDKEDIAGYQKRLEYMDREERLLRESYRKVVFAKLGVKQQP